MCSSSVTGTTDDLSVIEIGIHRSILIKEPGVDLSYRLLCVGGVPRDDERESIVEDGV